MSHYAVFKRDVYELIPIYKERVNLVSSSLYNSYYSLETKYEGVVHTSMFAGIPEGYLVNCITHITNNKEKVIFWEGELNLNELQVGDNVSIEEDTFKVKYVIKNVDGTITYEFDNNYIKSKNYDELYNMCEEQYNKNRKILIDELNNKNKKIKEEEKSLWSKIFG